MASGEEYWRWSIIGGLLGELRPEASPTFFAGSIARCVGNYVASLLLVFGIIDRINTYVDEKLSYRGSFLQRKTNVIAVTNAMQKVPILHLH